MRPPTLDWDSLVGKTDPMMQVMGAWANSSRPPLTYEQAEAQRKAAHKADPRHIAALKRRRKRKRGGPK